VRRWDSLNEQQLELLKRIDVDEDLGGPEHAHLRRSANALRDRGLISLSKRGGIWRAEMAQAGRFYLDHGHHPDDPRFAPPQAQHPATTPAKSTPVGAQPQPKPAKAVGANPTRARRQPPLATARTVAQRHIEATKLVERLVADELVVIKAPTDADIARWRKIVDFAKRHDLVPEGHRIEKTQQWNRDRDLHIRLIKGRHINATRDTTSLPQVPVPESLRAPHPIVAELRDDKGRLVMPKAIRQRSLLILQALVAEVCHRGYQVTKKPVAESDHFHYYGYGDRPEQRYSRREGELNIIVDGFTYAVAIQETSPQSEDPDKIGRLTIELPYHRDRSQQRWADGKVRRLEEALPAILQDLETRAVADREHKRKDELAKAERRVQWEHAMTIARQKATEAHYSKILDQQVARWKHAKEVRTYRDELTQRLANPQPADGDLDGARRWLDWINEHITRSDPTETPPAMPTPPQLTHDDLKLHLGKWSPQGPEDHIPSWQRRYRD